ncbi:MAG: SDR family NAD(P)-dependent oxidoreductase [Cytophagales bacterium]|nr:SDR family NAD(P)-dependent oxidoreductase [Cytophagales bacterium]
MRGNRKRYTLITGASMGLGKSLAQECAKRGHNLLLVSLPGERIDALASELGAAFPIEVVAFEKDLTNECQLSGFIKLIAEFYKVSLLINNAGMGGTKEFLSASEDYISRIILLNIRALVLLTRHLLPVLKAQPDAYVLNIASMASFGPIPFKTIYPASKAFVRSFSMGLCEELKYSNVQVSVACPGGMPTNREVSRRIMRHSRIVRWTVLDPDEVARICLREMYRGKAQIIPGKMGKLSWLFLKLCPESIRLPLMRKSVMKELSEENKLMHG